ncbi:MAG TPA: cbb3-type cytochrome oxidase assembly protein CcoS [Burkholderiales bacterium]|nr:cbb3-type cytochrome oxidase assembly protein CcoS [Burkholderiales bacterium]
MESLYILIPVSLVFVFVIGWAFWRALESGQFDDLDRASQDLLADDDRPKESGSDHDFPK